MGFDVPPGAPNDMVVAIRLDDDTADAALDDATDRRRRGAGRRGHADPGPEQARTAADDRRRAGVAPRQRPGAGLGAGRRARSSRRWTRSTPASDVMIFSDNVPVEQEVALKRAASERGLLVMGPDCGTAVVGGVGLGFANVVRPGPVGIVAASGTGCQQLLCLLDHAGVGVSSALRRRRPRPVRRRCAAISTRQALRRLDADPAVELIVVVSKPPADEVAAEIASTPPDSHTRRVRAARPGPARPDRRAPRRCCAGWAATSRRGRWPARPRCRPARVACCAGCSSAAPCATRRC